MRILPLLFFSTLGLMASAQSKEYALNFSPTEKVTHPSRFLSSVGISTSRGAQQQVRERAHSYTYSPNSVPFCAFPGESLRFDFAFSTGWMHGYVYLDRNQNGKFDVTEGADSELISYSYHQGKNSLGNEVAGNVGVAPPSYMLPKDIAPGIYRLRFKVDWNNVDPAGALSPDDGSPMGPNGILKNGGAIADVLLNIQSPTTPLVLDVEPQTLRLADGQALPSSIAPNTPLSLSIVPPAGKLLNQLNILSGYQWDGPQHVHGNSQWQLTSLPGYLLRNGQLTLPASLIWGQVRLRPEYVSQTPSLSATPYPLHFEPSLSHSNTAPKVLQAFQVNSSRGHSQKFLLNGATARKVYHDFTRQYEQQVSLLPGDNLQLHFTASTPHQLHAYLYLDLNQDGQFLPLLKADGRPEAIGELVAYNHYQGKNSLGEDSPTTASLSLPPYTLPEGLPTGVYRARLVLDHNSIDPSGRYQASGDALSIAQTGGHIVDFLLNVHEKTSSLRLTTEHGNLYGRTAALPERVPSYQALPIRLVPVAAGYERTEFTIRHGHHLDGPQYIHGNRQWEEFSPSLSSSATAYTLPAHLTDAQIEIIARFAPGPRAQYLPVLAEEFDAADGTQPDAQLWKRSKRYPGVTWARFISNAPEAVFVDKGTLVCRALPTPEREKATGETQPMISGAVESRGLFDFQYGKIEGRIRTHKHAGNFPAFWLMPTPGAGHKGWPWEGEIDIWEQIDSEDVSYHTIHSNWSYNLKQTQLPKSSHSGRNIDMDQYHTYGLEWTPTQLKWTVDGKEVGVYNKSTNKSHLAQGQWPFDRKFYIILNQSVGNGSWAQAADEHHTYETRFDWVRVYQTKAQNPTLGLATAPLLPSSLSYYDLSGRRVAKPTSGVYIVDGQKVLLP